VPAATARGVAHHQRGGRAGRQGEQSGHGCEGDQKTGHSGQRIRTSLKPLNL